MNNSYRVGTSLAAPALGGRTDVAERRTGHSRLLQHFQSGTTSMM